VKERIVLETLDARIKILLPEEYRDSYEAVQPVSMGSAGLKYDADGQVAWDQMWGSFCDLAMAGGPPHKGMLLEPGTESEIDANYGRYDEVVEEICRGIRLVTGLRSYMSPTPGWVCVTCLGDGMAGWLLRAIVMENVAARCRGAVLELPAAPHFRLEKEIKNVITVIAKTCHYWLGHMPREQQQAIAELFVTMAGESPLIEPQCSRSGRTWQRHRAERRPCGIDSARHRPSSVGTSLRRLARSRVPDRPLRGVDDARAGRDQRAVAARGNRALRSAEYRNRPARNDRRASGPADPSLRIRPRPLRSNPKNPYVITTHRDTEAPRVKLDLCPDL
jgi:hypothetical protein